jgi:hypothetical protein
LFYHGRLAYREESWHDLFNALVWLTFPRAKATLNAQHLASMTDETPSARGCRRDALTQFDEDGMVVVTFRPDLLGMLRSFQWAQLFWQHREDVQHSIRWFIFGHAQYEKALNPFVGQTAKGICLIAEPGWQNDPLSAQLEWIDEHLSAYLASPALSSPVDLSPVPVLGIPGWYGANQSQEFYFNTHYFRPGRKRQPA